MIIRYLKLIISKMTTEQNPNDKILGYASTKDCMVSLPPQSAHGGPITIEPLRPITNPEGYLTGFQPALEKYVKSGILRHIMIGDKAYGSWNDRQRIKNTPRMPPAPEEKVAKYGEMQRVDISSSRGIQNITEETQPTVVKNKGGRPRKIVEPSAPAPEQLKESQEPEERDGKFWIGTKEFPSRAAAIAFQRIGG